MFKIKQQWIAPEWEDALKQADLLNIESVSKREFDWFEEPNRRRGGWSGVTRLVLNPEAAPQDQQAVFLKIQQNHFYRAPNTFFTKQLTFEREFEVLRQLDIVTDSIPELVLFENGAPARMSARSSSPRHSTAGIHSPTGFRQKRPHTSG